jgi:general stress protein 26
MSSKDQSQNAEKLWQKIQGIEFAMLTTVDSQTGCIRSRPMATASKDMSDGNIWFFTKGDSPKVNDVESSSKVNLAYVRPPATFVSVCGKAQIVHDIDLAKSLWSPLIGAYFKKGPEDPDIALLKVQVQNAEIWDTTSGSMEYITHALKSDTEEEVLSHGVHQQFSLADQPS